MAAAMACRESCLPRRSYFQFLSGRGRFRRASARAPRFTGPIEPRVRRKALFPASGQAEPVGPVCGGPRKKRAIRFVRRTRSGIKEVPGETAGRPEMLSAAGAASRSRPEISRAIIGRGIARSRSAGEIGDFQFSRRRSARGRAAFPRGENQSRLAPSGHAGAPRENSSIPGRSARGRDCDRAGKSREEPADRPGGQNRRYFYRRQCRRCRRACASFYFARMEL